MALDFSCHAWYYVCVPRLFASKPHDRDKELGSISRKGAELSSKISFQSHHSTSSRSFPTSHSTKKKGEPLSLGDQVLLGCYSLSSGPLGLSSKTPFGPTISSGLKYPKHATTPGVPPSAPPTCCFSVWTIPLAMFPPKPMSYGNSTSAKLSFPRSPQARIQSAFPRLPECVVCSCTFGHLSPRAWEPLAFRDFLPPPSLKPSVQEESPPPIRS